MHFEWLAIVMFVGFFFIMLTGYPVAFSFAGSPDPEGAGPPGGIDGNEASHIDLAAQAGQQAIGMRKVAGPDEHRRPRNHPTIDQLDTGQPVSLDHQPRDLAAHDPNSTCFQPDAFGWRQVIGVDEEDHVVGPLPHQLCMHDRAGLCAQNPDALIADLPSVAVRAVQQITAPSLADARDLRQLVVDPGGDQDPPRPQHPATGQANEEPNLDPHHLILEQLHAVAAHLGPSRGQQVGRRHPVAGQEPLHVSRGSVAGRSGIDHGDPAPGSAQYEGRTQAGRSAADHHHVMNLSLHSDHLPPRVR